MASSSDDDDLSGLTQNTFKANDVFNQWGYEIFSDTLQTESSLDFGVEEQKLSSKNTSECFVVEGPCALETVRSKRAISLVTDEELEQRKDGRIPTNTKHNTNWAIRVWKDWAFERNSLTNNSTAEKSVRADILTNTNKELGWQNYICIVKPPPPQFFLA